MAKQSNPNDLPSLIKDADRINCYVKHVGSFKEFPFFKGVSQLALVCRFSVDSTAESNRKCGIISRKRRTGSTAPIIFDRSQTAAEKLRDRCKLVYETVLDRFEINLTISCRMLDLIMVDLFEIFLANENLQTGINNDITLAKNVISIRNYTNEIQPQLTFRCNSAVIPKPLGREAILLYSFEPTLLSSGNFYVLAGLTQIIFCDWVYICQE